MEPRHKEKLQLGILLPLSVLMLSSGHDRSRGVVGDIGLPADAITQQMRGLPYTNQALPPLTAAQRELYEIAIERVKKSNESVIIDAVESLSAFNPDRLTFNWVFPDLYAPELQRKIIDEIERRYPSLDQTLQFKAVDALAQMGASASAIKKLEAMAATYGDDMSGKSEWQAGFLWGSKAIMENTGKFPDSLRDAARVCVSRQLDDRESSLFTMGSLLPHLHSEELIQKYLDRAYTSLEFSDGEELSNGASVLEDIQDLADGDPKLKKMRQMLTKRCFDENVLTHNHYFFLSFIQPDSEDSIRIANQLMAKDDKKSIATLISLLQYCAHQGDTKSLRHICSIFGVTDTGVNSEKFLRLDTHHRETLIESCIILGPEFVNSVARSMLQQPGYESFEYSALLKRLPEAERAQYIKLLSSNGTPDQAKAAKWDKSEDLQAKENLQAFMKKWNAGTAGRDEFFEALHLKLSQQIYTEMLDQCIALKDEGTFLITRLAEKIHSDTGRTKILQHGIQLYERGDKTGIEIIFSLAHVGFSPAIRYASKHELFLGNSGTEIGYDQLAPVLHNLTVFGRQDEAKALALEAIAQMLRRSKFETTLSIETLYHVAGKEHWRDIAKIAAKHPRVEFEPSFLKTLSEEEVALLIPIWLAERNHFRKEVSYQASVWLMERGHSSSAKPFILSDIQNSCTPEGWSVVTGLKLGEPSAFEELRRQLTVVNFDSVFLREQMNALFRDKKSRDVLLDALSKVHRFLSPESQAYADALRECPKLNIFSPFRLNPEALLEAVRQRTSIVHDPRPLAVYVIARDDWNGALNIPPVGHEEIFRRFQVKYFEASKDSEVAKGLKFSNIQTGKQCSFLFINGHGRPSALALGAIDPAKSRAHMTTGPEYLDFTDTKLLREQFSPYMAPGSITLLLSCSVGGKGSAVTAARENETKSLELYGSLSNYVADNLYFDKSGGVYGPMKPISGSEVKVKIDKSGTVTVFPGSKIALFKK